MKLSDRTYIIILIIAILSLSLITYWRFQRVREGLPQIQFPAFEMPEMKLDLTDSLFSEKEGAKTWISPDNKLQLNYSISWVEMDENILMHGAETGILLEEARTLLFLYRFKMAEQAYAFLMVSRTPAEKSLEEIIKEAEQNLKMGGGKTEIKILKTENKFTDLEIISKQPASPISYSRVKIIFTGKENYLILFNSLQKDWLYFEEEAKEVFNSVELLE